MKSSRFRLTVMPVFVALFTSVMALQPLNIFRVDARGLGHEHAMPKRGASATFATPLLALLTLLKRFKSAWLRVDRHAWFRPAAVAAALLLAFVLDARSLYAAPILFGTLSEGRHAGEFIYGERPDGGSRDNLTVLSGQNLKAGAVLGRVTLGIGRVSVPTVVGTGNGTVSVVFAGPEVQVGNYVVTCSVAATDGGTFTVTNPSGKSLPTATVGTAYTSREINFTIADGSSDYIVGDVFTFVVSTTAPTVLGGTGTGTISALSLGPDAKPGRYQVIAIEAITNGGRWQVFGPDGTSIGEYLQTAGSTTATAFTNREINFTITDATDFIVGNSFEVCVFNQLAGGKAVAWDPTTFDGRHRVAGVLYDNVDASAGDLAGVAIARDAVVLKDSLEWATAIKSGQKESAYLEMAKLGIIAR